MKINPQDIFKHVASIEETQEAARQKMWDLRYSLIMRFVYGVKLENVEMFVHEPLKHGTHVRHAVKYLQLGDTAKDERAFRKICGWVQWPTRHQVIVKTGYRIKGSDEHHKLPFICHDSIIANILWKDPLGVVPADKIFADISLTRDLLLGH